MKTAICILGLPREINEIWHTTHEHLIKQLPNPDVFIYSGEHYPTNQQLFDILKPVKYIIEPQHPFPEKENYLKNTFYPECHANAVLQQFYSWKKIKEIKEEYEKENNITYDIVVKTRADFIWFNPISLDMFPEVETNIATLHTKYNSVVPTEFAIGPNNLMNSYFSIFDWIGNESKNFLTEDHPQRLSHPDKVYNSDIILNIYIRQYHKLQIGEVKYREKFYSPYDYYRIYHIHKTGAYGPIP